MVKTIWHTVGWVSKIPMSTITSGGMNVSVINPIYEKVSLKFNVKFIEGYNEKLGFKKLKDKIISFLDPWKSENLIKFFEIINWSKNIKVIIKVLN